MAGASGFHVDGHVQAGCFEYGLSVPVGEAKAAVGFRATDLFGFGGSVNTVAGTIKADPSSPDRIVGSGGDDETAVDAFPLGDTGENLRIEGVVGVGG